VQKTRKNPDRFCAAAQKLVTESRRRFGVACRFDNMQSDEYA
jgi:hypothetical protein